MEKKKVSRPCLLKTLADERVKTNKQKHNKRNAFAATPGDAEKTIEATPQHGRWLLVVAWRNRALCSVRGGTLEKPTSAAACEKGARRNTPLRATVSWRAIQLLLKPGGFSLFRGDRFSTSSLCFFVVFF